MVDQPPQVGHLYMQECKYMANINFWLEALLDLKVISTL